MCFEGQRKAKFTTGRPTLTTKATWEPWGYMQNQGKQRWEASVSYHDPVKCSNKQQRLASIVLITFYVPDTTLNALCVFTN